MVQVSLGIPSHDVLPGVSAGDHHAEIAASDLNHQDLAARGASDHHTATVAGDLNLADLAERLHASLASVGVNDHLTDVSKASMEAETVVTRALRADRVRFSPGVAKVWCSITAAGLLESPSYNVASITDTATGDRTVVIDDDFSTNIYAGAVTTAALAGNGHQSVTALAVGSCRVFMNDDGGTAEDAASTLVLFGDQ